MNVEMPKLIIVIVDKEEQLDLLQLRFGHISVREISRTKENTVPGRSLGELIGK